MPITKRKIDMFKLKPTDPEKMIQIDELSKLTGLTPAFWRKNRTSDHPLTFYKISHRCVLYRWGDVEDWLKRHRQGDTND